MTLTKARCRTCKVVYVWTPKPIVRNAICRKCGNQLDATTDSVKKRLPKIYQKPTTHEKKGTDEYNCYCDYCRVESNKEDEKIKIARKNISNFEKQELTVDTSQLEIIGYVCLVCTSPKNGRILCTDYKEHLRTKHKIVETHIPKILENSPWEEDFVVLYKTEHNCPICNVQMRLCKFREDKDFLVLDCVAGSDERHANGKGHTYQRRILVGTKLKYTCIRHGTNSDKEPCYACDMENKFSRIFS